MIGKILKRDAMDVSAVFKLEIYIPMDALDDVLDALHEAGAGVIGNYDHCFAVTQVSSTFRPLEGANPTLGRVGEMVSTGEAKVEVNVREPHLMAAIEAVRRVHPYEEPLINILPLANARYGGTM
jgi:hypothetical protein